MFPSVSFFPELFESQLIGQSTLLLDLEADTGVTVSNVDKIDVWSDQSGSGFNLTQTGAARPTLTTVGGYSCVQLDGVDDWMLGQDWSALDNMDSFTIVTVVANITLTGTAIITKMNNDGCHPDCKGWSISKGSDSFGFSVAMDSTDGFNNTKNQWATGVNYAKSVWTFEMVSRALDTMANIYLNSALDNHYATPDQTNYGTGASDYSTSEPVRLGIDGHGGDCDHYGPGDFYAIRVYSPVLNATQRATVEQELAA